MARLRARRKNARSAPKPAPTRRPRRAAGPARDSAGTVALAEPPHAHIVCQQCGRITEVLLTPAQRTGLLRLAGQRPGGWSVTRLAFSMTGRCPRCPSRPATA
jgi:Fe2+ or Zn2+ uptake regulation protein